jgi:putative membrane protein
LTAWSKKTQHETHLPEENTMEHFPSKLVLAITALLFAVLPAQARQCQTGSGAQSTASGTAAAPRLNKSDQKIVTQMAQANMAEIEAAKLAQSKSQNEQVKTFAQQMIDDHTKALGEVQTLAQAKGVSLPTELDKANKAKADKLGAMGPDAFDHAYMSQAGVADHKKVHGMLRQAQAKARDPDLKALAGRILPTVDQHLKSAQQLHKQAPGKGAKANTAGT